jgi:hypothetical protein
MVLRQQVVPSYGLFLFLDYYAIVCSCLSQKNLTSELVGPALEVKRGPNLSIKRYAPWSNTRVGLVGLSCSKQQYQKGSSHLTGVSVISSQESFVLWL